MWWRRIFIVSVILLLISGVIFRIYDFTHTPAFHVDELAFGYSSFALGKTGADEFGQKFPLILESFGDYKLALYSYFLLPFMAVLGLSDWAVRLPSIIFGFLTIVLVYFFIKEYLGDKKIAALSAFLLLISPWHIIFSRTANEVSMQVFLIMLLFYFWVRHLNTGRNIFRVASLVTLILATISYYSSFVFIPLITLSFIFIYKKKSVRNLITPFVVTIVLIILLFFTQPLQRVSQTSLFQHGQIQALITEALQEEGHAGNLFVARLFHNKIYMSFLLIVKNYFDHFTPDFLFLQGDTNYGRYSIPFSGPLYLWELPFILTGLNLVFVKVIHKKDTKYLLFPVWILLAMIPDALSFMGTNTQRTVIAVPMFEVLTAMGLWQWYVFLKTKNILLRGGIYLLFLSYALYQYLSFMHNYFVHQNVHQPWYRESYGKETVQTINEVSGKYKKTVITGTSPMLFLFYGRIDPQEARRILSNRTVDGMGFNHLAKFENYMFMPIDCPTQGKTGVLYVCQGNKVAYNTNIIKVIRYGDGQPARIFLTFADPTEKISHQLSDRIGYFEETIKDPRIISSSEDRYW
ncbi:MAG: glycosyltransferase family 39 protein [Patescibacteria group bacterium]|nr:glycosyltransferase family 39 protein [Patescibacteria group bacterium]